MRATANSSPRAARGVILIEVLIGILIFSVGILGLMGLQAVSMRNTVEARHRAEASFLANQLLARMWVSDRTDLATNFAVTTSTLCTSGGASPRNQWLCEVEATLPGIAATSGGANRPTVSFSGNDVTITLRWQIPGGDARNYLVLGSIN